MSVPPDDTVTPADARRSSGLPWRLLGECAAVMAASTAVFLAVFRPWGNRIRVPFSYGQDSIFYAMVVKTMILQGLRRRSGARCSARSAFVRLPSRR
jgi:hypothetical protein